jgi:DNA-binding NtrC family response regulator
VRELQNKVKRLEVMAEMVADGDLVELSRSLLSVEDKERDHSLTGRVAEFERQLIVEALVAASGNKSKAARLLGIHEATVRTKLKRYGISLAS